jgi:hypothetical protein
MNYLASHWGVFKFLRFYGGTQAQELAKGEARNAGLISLTMILKVVVRRAQQWQDRASILLLID